jgi:hypothetical protein
MKVLYLALAGGSIDHDHHKNSQIDTWALNNNSHARVIWMHGDPNLVIPKLEGNNLFLPIEEKYENLLEKTLLAVRWVIENIDFDFLIRTNTSNYFHHPLVEKHLSRYKPDSPIVAGVAGTWRGTIKGERNRHSFISGAGIYMSKVSVRTLSLMNANDYKGIPDDVAISHWFKLNKTRFRVIPRNNISDFKPIWPTPQTRVKSWNKPILTCNRMYDVHKIYSSEDGKLLRANIKNFKNREISSVQDSQRLNKFLFTFQYKVMMHIIYFRFKKFISKA